MTLRSTGAVQCALQACTSNLMRTQTQPTLHKLGLAMCSFVAAWQLPYYLETFRR